MNERARELLEDPGKYFREARKRNAKAINEEGIPLEKAVSTAWLTRRPYPMMAPKPLVTVKGRLMTADTPRGVMNTTMVIPSL